MNATIKPGTRCGCREGSSSDPRSAHPLHKHGPHCANEAVRFVTVNDTPTGSADVQDDREVAMCEICARRAEQKAEMRTPRRGLLLDDPTFREEYMHEARHDEGGDR